MLFAELPLPYLPSPLPPPLPPPPRAGQAPVAALSMWAVPSVLRPLAISLMTVVIHLLGDVPSPPLLGWLQATLSEGKTGQGGG